MHRCAHGLSDVKFREETIHAHGLDAIRREAILQADHFQLLLDVLDADGERVRVVKHDRPKLKKISGPGIEPFELLSIRIRLEILSHCRKFHQNSSEIEEIEDLSIFSKLFIEHLIKFH